MAEALLVGSVNLPTAEEVFKTAAREFGSTIKRIPDGETGSRVAFVASVLPVLRATPELTETGTHLDDFTAVEDFATPLFAIRDGLSGDDIELGPLGYADWARASYATFSDLVERGVVAPSTRFQVSLPSPITFVAAFTPVKDQEQMIAVWERALVREIEQMAESIPLDRLGIQWDIPVEVGLLEHFFDYFSEPDADALGADLARLAGHVPTGAEVGFHLCYGDAPAGQGEKGRHWKEPDDMAIMVSLANAIFAASNRPIAWIHMPVPLDRDDDAYFRPLADLKLPEETELYLGLVHEEDGTEGAQKRIDIAARYVKGFGVATECGMGRESAGSVPGIMALHRDLVVPA